jgi:hypothetical protein
MYVFIVAVSIAIWSGAFYIVMSGGSSSFSLLCLCHKITEHGLDFHQDHLWQVWGDPIGDVCRIRESHSLQQSQEYIS